MSFSCLSRESRFAVEDSSLRSEGQALFCHPQLVEGSFLSSLRSEGQCCFVILSLSKDLLCGLEILHYVQKDSTPPLSLRAVGVAISIRFYGIQSGKDRLKGRSSL